MMSFSSYDECLLHRCLLASAVCENEPRKVLENPVILERLAGSRGIKKVVRLPADSDWDKKAHES